MYHHTFQLSTVRLMWPLPRLSVEPCNKPIRPGSNGTLITWPSLNYRGNYLPVHTKDAGRTPSIGHQYRHRRFPRAVTLRRRQSGCSQWSSPHQVFRPRISRHQTLDRETLPGQVFTQNHYTKTCLAKTELNQLVQT